MRHVVWDWNGTLFDDQHLVLEGLNAVLVDAGLVRIDLATYQRLYTRPLDVFYERLLGRPVTADDWPWIDEVYHAGYRAGLDRAGLAADAENVLTRVGAEGSQSLLSMWHHRELIPLVTRLGIHDRFVRIDGLRQLSGGVKAPYLEAHLAALAASIGDDRRRVVMIGDALDDAAAAAHVGVRCILFDGGSHPRAMLEQAGVPVAATLTEALDRAWS